MRTYDLSSNWMEIRPIQTRHHFCRKTGRKIFRSFSSLLLFLRGTLACTVPTAYWGTDSSLSSRENAPPPALHAWGAWIINVLPPRGRQLPGQKSKKLNHVIQLLAPNNLLLLPIPKETGHLPEQTKKKEEQESESIDNDDDLWTQRGKQRRPESEQIFRLLFRLWCPFLPSSPEAERPDRTVCITPRPNLHPSPLLLGANQQRSLG